MLEDNDISIKPGPGAKLPGGIIPGVIHRPARGSQDGGTGSIVKLHPVVRFASPALGASKRVATVYSIGPGWGDGGLEDEVAILKAIICPRRIAGDGCGG